MKVLFENSKGETREIAEVWNEQEAFEKINEFCEERNFVIHYTRGWEREDGTKVIDVGSYTEFFHIVE